MRLKGKLITFEGAEGSGKSTQACLVHTYLSSRKIPVVFVREPGGVKISEEIRKLLLNVRNRRMTRECEMLLYMASRAQLVEEKIIPALNKGRIVLCDRYLDSTLAYQGFGNGQDLDFIRLVGRYATQSIQPDLTLLFDIDAETGLERAGKIKDRIEQRPLEYHRRVRQGYLKLAKREPGRIKVIKVDGDKQKVFEAVRRHVEEFISK